MLIIERATYDAIVAHARRDHPDEACGLVAGATGSDLPTRHIPMDNAARSMTFYEFGSMEQFRVWREMDERDVDQRFASIVAGWDSPVPDPASSGDVADGAATDALDEPSPDEGDGDASRPDPGERPPWVNPSPLDIVVPASSWRVSPPPTPGTPGATASPAGTGTSITGWATTATGSRRPRTWASCCPTA